MTTKKRHTGKVQVVVEAATGGFVAVSEVVPGPRNDLQLLRDIGRWHGWTTRGRCWAICPMWALPNCIRGQTARRKPRSKPRPAEDVATNRDFARRRAVVEHSLQRLRRFAKASERDRHHRVDNGRSVACAGLVDCQLLTQVSR